MISIIFLHENKPINNSVDIVVSFGGKGFLSAKKGVIYNSKREKVYGYDSLSFTSDTSGEIKIPKVLNDGTYNLVFFDEHHNISPKSTPGTFIISKNSSDTSEREAYEKRVKTFSTFLNQQNFNSKDIPSKVKGRVETIYQQLGDLQNNKIYDPSSNFIKPLLNSMINYESRLYTFCLKYFYILITLCINKSSLLNKDDTTLTQTLAFILYKNPSSKNLFHFALKELKFLLVITHPDKLNFFVTLEKDPWKQLNLEVNRFKNNLTNSLTITVTLDNQGKPIFSE